MKINIGLSEESISAAIARLRVANENLRWGVDETVDILTKEGEEIAQAADGSMAVVKGYRPDENTGVIVATGSAPVIAEFGAGDATMPVMFENYPGVDVYPGAYSEQVGTGEYAETGKWHFGGKVYREVEPRAGLLQAKIHIQDQAVEIVKEVIKL